MKNEDKEEMKKIANEEMDKRVKPKKGKVYGDPVADIEY